MSERLYLDLSELHVRRLASLLIDACHTANELDEFGSPGFRKRGNDLRLSAQMFADCLPALIALTVADEVRKWSGEIAGDDAHSVAIRSLLRHLDPSGSPKVR